MTPTPDKCIIYVVDDDEAVRDSLHWLLEGKGWRVHTFRSAEIFLSHFDPYVVACLFVDIRMDGMSGLELQEQLIASESPLPIAFITGHGDVPMAVDTMKKGAVDFIQKPFQETELIALVEKMQAQAHEAFAKSTQAKARTKLMAKLTGRELQILNFLVAGRLNKQIAEDLHLSVKTVETHRANIMKKLRAKSFADLLLMVLDTNTTDR